jgi:hypothetical protein
MHTFAILFFNQTTIQTLRLNGHLELHFGNAYVKEEYLNKNFTPFTSRQLCKKWLIWFCATLGSVRFPEDGPFRVETSRNV